MNEIRIDDLKDLGFSFLPDVYKNGFSWVYGKRMVRHSVFGMHEEDVVYFNHENYVASASNGEFSNIHRECRTSEELNKFIECIEFLFKIEKNE